MRPDTPAATVPAHSAATLGAGLALRWALFRALEWLSALKNRGASAADSARINPPPPFGRGIESIWIFVSTIGELNAVEPFLRPFVAEMRPTPVTLLTDRRIYRESYLAKYPETYVYEMDGTSGDVERLIALTPPKLLLIAEIPCLLSDAPCRFPFATVYGARRAGAPVLLVNGWIYGNVPPSRIDAIERYAFGRDYLRLIDLITVQTDDVRNRLIAEGADPARVHVTGNTKFDAFAQQDASPKGKQSEVILRALVDGGRPCIVAGCVTDYEDQVMVLDAFGMVVERFPNALLVLAPRHPENREMMTTLEALLRERKLRHLFRSRVADAPLAADAQLLVLDTMGELRDFYAASTISYVGRDHNILEPLTFGKPVTISPGWEATYPSYPVYLLLRGTGSVRELDGSADHAQHWIQVLSRSAAFGGIATHIADDVARLRGAAQSNLQLVKRTLSASRREHPADRR